VIQHTVAFRLRDSVDAEEFWRRVEELRELPGVRQFSVLRQVGQKNDFDHALSMYFESQADYEGYNGHPVHIAFVVEAWVPNVADFIELDYVDDN
jgi:hypothetical protein